MVVVFDCFHSSPQVTAPTSGRDTTTVPGIRATGTTATDQGTINTDPGTTSPVIRATKGITSAVTETATQTTSDLWGEKSARLRKTMLRLEPDIDWI